MGEEGAWKNVVHSEVVEGGMQCAEPRNASFDDDGASKESGAETGVNGGGETLERGGLSSLGKWGGIFPWM